MVASHATTACHNARAMRLYALRGATTVEANAADEILSGTTELMQGILERNVLTPDDIVSCIFSVTDDLNAAFPATAARHMGFERVPLLCTREIPVPGSLPKVIRVLMHFYADEPHDTQHVYLHQARALRNDLEAAQ
jgi:chorismate mutase